MKKKTCAFQSTPSIRHHVHRPTINIDTHSLSNNDNHVVVITDDGGGVEGSGGGDRWWWYRIPIRPPLQLDINHLALSLRSYDLCPSMSFGFMLSYPFTYLVNGKICLFGQVG